MTAPFRSDDTLYKQGFIGGAASTISTLAYLIQERRGQKNRSIEALVFDPQGLNVGPGYNVTNPAFSLNQPSGQEMDPFHGGGEGLPKSFLEFLTEKYPGQGITAASYDTRPHYGEYLSYVIDWVREEAPKVGIFINEVPVLVDGITVAGYDNAGKPTEYALTDNQGNVHAVNGVTIATGHTIEPRIKEPHELYIGSYAGPNFEARLKALAEKSTPDSVINFAGSGASSVDIIAALENYGYKGTYNVISPYGKTYWNNDPDAPKPSDPNLAKQLIDTFVRDARSNPLAAFNRALKHGARYGVAPLHVIVAAFEHPTVKARDELLNLVKTFYGNPLSPERFGLMERLSQREAGQPSRLQFEIGRADNPQPAGPHALTIDIFDGAATKVLHDPLVDCTITGRGTRRRDGSFTQQIFADIDRQGLLAENNGALEFTSSRGHSFSAVGVVTNAFKNGIESFRPGYKRVAAFVSSQASAWVPGQVIRPAAHNALQA